MEKSALILIIALQKALRKGFEKASAGMTRRFLSNIYFFFLKIPWKTSNLKTYKSFEETCFTKNSYIDLKVVFLFRKMSNQPMAYTPINNFP